MTEQLNVQQMAEKLLAADNILILCHKNPDGDTVGCGSALYYALLALEKHAAVLCADPIPGRYAFTNPRLFKGEFEPQIVVAVDVASVQLFGEGNGVPQYHAPCGPVHRPPCRQQRLRRVHAAGRQRRRCGRAAV